METLNNIKCKLCNNAFKKIENLNRHYRNFHNRKKDEKSCSKYLAIF